ncbi:MAG: radical SAM protein [Alphaproteobacteria bacterium]|nr:radical SAM protein [Alphaproteobacteria bacterium]
MSRTYWAAMPRPDRSSEAAVKLLRNYNYRLGNRPSTTMLTATGCPEQCTFCEEAMTGIRWADLDSLKAEMDDIKALDYGGVYLFDDLFAIAMAKVRPIATELAQRDLIYRCNAQARYYTRWGEDFARLLADTGCYEAVFGAESGSQTILDNVRKRTSVEMNYRTVEYAKKHGIIVKAFILLGLPGENRETLRETERFVLSSGIDDAQIAIYCPYKGTQIRETIERGDGDFDLTFSGEGLGAYGQKGGSTEAVVRTASLSEQQLIEFRD